MNRSIFLLFPFFFFGQNILFAQSKVDLQGYQLSTTKEEALVISVPNTQATGLASIFINGKKMLLNFSKGKAFINWQTDRKGELLFLKTEDKNIPNQLFHFSLQKNKTHRLQQIPLWLSLLPPLIAIILALIFKEVFVSLFIGIWSGAFIAGGLRLDSFYYFLHSIFEVVEKYIVAALTDGSHISIFVFTLLVGGMVAIISRNGGMAGIVQSLSKYARSPRSAQFITWLLGVAIFFDDYANTLIVGNTMRSVTDRFKISREKLAYIVDSTAAPVTAIAFITTWIGAELSYIDGAIQTIEGFPATTPYAIFISSMKYSFYPVLTLIFILMLIYTQKDFGEMHTAETRARTTGKVSNTISNNENAEDMEDLSPVDGAPLRWYNAAIPVLMVILVTIFGLIDTGIAASYQELLTNGILVPNSNWATVWAQLGNLLNGEATFFMKLGKLIGNANSYTALLWASFAGVSAAVLLTLRAKIMSLSETMTTMTTGLKAMLPALIILTLAWALAITTDELHTADYLSVALQDSVSPYAMPVIIFLLAAFIAFSTGSSWSPMAILYPIAIPTTWAICQTQNVEPDIAMEILLNVVATVLAASVVGDHCSPISDTTILSSLASDCNHIDHVRTQLPYALTVGSVSLVAVGLSTYFGGGWLISGMLLIVCIATLYLIIFRFGKKIH